MWWRYIILRVPFALASKLPKYNLKVSGAENVPRYGPFIAVSNHQSSADIIAIALALKPALVHRHIWPWAKKEIKAGADGLLGKLLWKVFGVIPIDRTGGGTIRRPYGSVSSTSEGENWCSSSRREPAASRGR
ncbi:MAG: lysophospholipid acyltransferase family protein [Actinomycetota bacterium]